MFNSPNTAAMMGTVPAHRRGIAAGARTLLQNTGAVLSIAFVLAIVTSAIPKATLFAIFSGLAQGLSGGEARAVHRTTCTSRCGCSRRPRCSAPASACCARPRSTDVDDGEPIDAVHGRGGRDGTGAQHAEPRAPVPAVGAR